MPVDSIGRFHRVDDVDDTIKNIVLDVSGGCWAVFIKVDVAVADVLGTNRGSGGYLWLYGATYGSRLGSCIPSKHLFEFSLDVGIVVNCFASIAAMNFVWLVVMVSME